MPAPTAHPNRSNPPLVLSWGTVAARSVGELAAAAAGAGFEGISVSPPLYEATRAAGTTDATMRAALAEHGVRVDVVEPLLSVLPATFTADTAPPELRALFATTEADAVRVAQALGAPAVSVSHFLGQPCPLQPLVDALGPLVERLAAEGLRTIVEFIPESAIADLPSALALHRAIGSPQLGLMVDSWHLARGGGAPADIAAIPPGALAALQLADRIEPPPGTAYVPMTGRLLPGDGDLALAELVSLALAHTPTLAVSVEVFSADLQAIPAADAARRAGAATRTVLAAR